MPGKRYVFGDTIYQLIKKMIENEISGAIMGGKLNLGGESGEDGGSGGWPRPPVGLLPQRYVANDTTEAETPELYGITRSGWWDSLLDNLNRIRYWERPARMFEPQFDGTMDVDVREGLWWLGQGDYVDFQGDDITVTTPHATLPRIDVVYVTDGGIASVSDGTPGVVPAATYPGGVHLPVAELWVKPLDASGITVSGIGYAYMSGYAQGYLYNDLRPYYGVNYDAEFSGAEYLPDLLDVDDDVTSTASHRQVLAYDTSIGQWTNMEFFYGGVGGGQPTLQVDGPIVTLDHVGGAYICTRSGELNSVYIYTRVPGTSGETIVDVNLDGTTVFTNPDHRPMLAYDDTNLVQRSATLSGISFSPETVFTVDIDEIATNAADLTIVLATDIETIHPHSDGPHTGVLKLDELQDGTISGYPLISDGNDMDGGPMYLPVNTAGIYDDAITFGKIGDGGIKMGDRQGGSASDWSDGTGTTNYDVSGTDLKMQTGAIDVSVAGPGNRNQQFTVTFPEAFSNPPTVVVSAKPATAPTSYITEHAILYSVSATQFIGYAGHSADATRIITVTWMAIGEE